MNISERRLNHDQGFYVDENRKESSSQILKIFKDLIISDLKSDDSKINDCIRRITVLNRENQLDYFLLNKIFSRCEQSLLEKKIQEGHEKLIRTFKLHMECLGIDLKFDESDFPILAISNPKIAYVDLTLSLEPLIQYFGTRLSIHLHPVNISSFPDLVQFIHQHKNWISSLNLDTVGVHLNEETLKSFNGMFNLKFLSLKSISKVKNFSFSGNFPNLLELKIASCEYLEELKNLHVLKNLKILRIDKCINLCRISDLNELKHLETITLIDCPRLVNIHQLQNCLNLKEITISKCPNLTDISCFTKLKKSLKALKIETCQQVEDFSTISSLKLLRRLTIKNCDKFEQVPDLKDLKNLKKINFSDCKNLKSISLMNLPEKLDILNLNKCPMISRESKTKLFYKIVDRGVKFDENEWKTIVIPFLSKIGFQGIDRVSSNSLKRNEDKSPFQFLIDYKNDLFNKHESRVDVMNILSLTLNEILDDQEKGIPFSLICQSYRKDPVSFQSNLIFFKLISDYRILSYRKKLAKYFVKNSHEPSFILNWRIVKQDVLKLIGDNKGKKVALIPLSLMTKYFQSNQPLQEPLYKGFLNILNGLKDGRNLAALTSLLVNPRFLKLEPIDAIHYLTATMFVDNRLTGNKKFEFVRNHWLVLKTLLNIETKNSWIKTFPESKDQNQSIVHHMHEVFKNRIFHDFKLSRNKHEDQSYEIFCRFRNPIALFSYLTNLKNFKKMHDLDYVNMLIQSVQAELNGTFSALKYQMNEHLQALFSERKELFDAWKKGSYKNAKDFHIEIQKNHAFDPNWSVVDTDNFEDMLLMGTEIQDSCLKVDGSIDLFVGLFGYILDGKHRLIAVKASDGKLVGRAVMRIMLDEKTLKPVLFREKIYVNNKNANALSLIKMMCQERAKELRLPLFAIDNLSYEEREKFETKTVISLGGPCPEYVDALKNAMLTDPSYEIEEAKLIYKLGSDLQ